MPRFRTGRAVRERRGAGAITENADSQPPTPPPPGGARWADRRAQIPAASRCIYFNSGWSGPLPNPVVEAIERELRVEWREGPTTQAVQDAQRARREQVREQFAAITQADADEVLLTQNTTQGLNIVLNGLDWRAGDRVVTTAVEHSSGLVPLYYLGARYGVEIDFVGPDLAVSQAELLAAFDEAIRPGVKLVLLSHISYATGLVFPLPRIVERAHAIGAQVLVDAAQAMGQMPLDLHGWEVDYYAVPGHKWLLGPDGIGALYVRRDRVHDLEPRAVGGRAASSFAYDGSGFAPERHDITKFQLTTSSAPLLAGLQAALAFYQDTGPAAAWDRIRSLGAVAAEALAALPGVTVISPRQAEMRSGLVSFRVAGREPRPLAEALQREYGVVCRAVAEQDAVRWSLHYFNREEEIERAVAALAALLALETETPA